MVDQDGAIRILNSLNMRPILFFLLEPACSSPVEKNIEYSIIDLLLLVII